MTAPVSETFKANLRLIVMGLVSAAGAAMTAITASGQDSFSVFAQKPSVLLSVLVAVGPIVITGLSRTPQQARAIDQEKAQVIEAKVDAKMDTKIANLVDLGVIPSYSAGTIKEISK